MGDLNEKPLNPLLQATPESKQFVKKMIDGMSPEDQASLVADLRERSEELAKMNEPAFREWLAETHRQNVSAINRQTMAERATENAAPDLQDNAPQNIVARGIGKIVDEIRAQAEESEKREAEETAALIGRENMH